MAKAGLTTNTLIHSVAAFLTFFATLFFVSGLKTYILTGNNAWALMSLGQTPPDAADPAGKTMRRKAGKQQ